MEDDLDPIDMDWEIGEELDDDDLEPRMRAFVQGWHEASATEDIPEEDW